MRLVMGIAHQDSTEFLNYYIIFIIHVSHNLSFISCSSFPSFSVTDVQIEIFMLSVGGAILATQYYC